MTKPLWLYVSYLPNNMKSTITLLGNPAVWWVGFASIIMVTAIGASQVIQSFRKKIKLTLDLPLAFIAVIFFFQWLPYAFITRGLFIYHFYVSVPFLCLGSTYFINKYWSNKWGKVAAVIFFASVVALFVLFYPVISGTPVSSSTVDSLRWFGGWFF
jgi:dolichyl-phosphate-mannose-protein mannosyltransferase